MTLLAERAGVSVLPVVAAGMASEQDALLVRTEATGRPLRTGWSPGKSTTGCWKASGTTPPGSTPSGWPIDGWTPPGS